MKHSKNLRERLLIQDEFVLVSLDGLREVGWDLAKPDTCPRGPRVQDSLSG